MKHLGLAVANRMLAAIFLPVAVVVVLATRLRHRRGQRIMLGTSPIITIRDIALVMRSRGWTATTVVREVYSIHGRDDFDVLMDELLPRPVRLVTWRPLREVLADYCTFLWAVPRFDVFLGAFDGRMLMRTPLRHLELPLLHLARKRVVLVPYGSDIQSLDRIADPDVRDRLGRQYPRSADADARTRTEVAHCCRHADVVVNGVDWIDFVERADVLAPTPFYVDVDRFSTASHARTGGPVRIGHAPNHRTIKGTDLLEAAVETLSGEGLDVELVVIERIPNAEVPAVLAGLDLFAEQFVLGWYGLAAVEAMAAGLPVVARLRPDLVAAYAHLAAGRPPIVAADPDQLVDVLRSLALDPARRVELGRAGRRFVEEHHSLAGLDRLMGDVLERLYPAGPDLPRLPRPTEETSS